MLFLGLLLRFFLSFLEKIDYRYEKQKNYQVQLNFLPVRDNPEDVLRAGVVITRTFVSLIIVIMPDNKAEGS